MKALSLRRAAAWLALWGMALNASWPLVADARPANPASPSEICSATGLKHAASGENSNSRDECIRHCTLCSLTAERTAAIPTRTPALRIPPPASRRAAAIAEAPRFESALRLGAPPRAPPLPS